MSTNVIPLFRSEFFGGAPTCLARPSGTGSRVTDKACNNRGRPARAGGRIVDNLR